MPGSTLPTLDELAIQYGADTNTISRAISEVLEPEGLVWAVPKRGTIVRHGMSRRRRMRGSPVMNDIASSSPRYSLTSVPGREAWQHHIQLTASRKTLDDPRLARLLNIPVGSETLRSHTVTGPEAEPPFQASDSWVHPRVADIPGLAAQGPRPDSWRHEIENAGHGPLSWTEYHRSRLPTRSEAAELQIPASLPVMEIVRVGCSALDGQPVEVAQAVIPGDRVEMVHELPRDSPTPWPWPEDQGMNAKVRAEGQGA